MARNIDNIALEVKELIVQHLEEEDAGPGYPIWPQLTEKSRRNILSIRQVSLIGDLTFRLIQFDLDDLADISNDSNLSRWINTITFGTGGFDELAPSIHPDDYDDENYGTNPCVFRDLMMYTHKTQDKDSFSTVAEKYVKCSRDQEELYQSGGGANQLTTILQTLPQLKKNVRIKTFDPVGRRSTHLRGWITPKERPLFKKIWTDFLLATNNNDSLCRSSDAEIIKCAEHMSRIYKEWSYQRSFKVLPVVFAALARLAKHLEDIRTAGLYYRQAPEAPSVRNLFEHLPGTLSFLHTLRVTIQSADANALSNLLGTTSSIRDIEIKFPRPETDGHKERTMRRVVPALTTTKNSFIQMRLTGFYSIQEKDLITLLQAHLGTLRCLEMVGVCVTDSSANMDGDVNGVLRHVVTENPTGLRDFYLAAYCNFGYTLWDPKSKLDKTILAGITFSFEIETPGNDANLHFCPTGDIESKEGH
ncbi:uncharacterized protein BDZ99DRAFT_499221 [Mytilinidion resinicola]|uniref:Uncharacterized protein n=1 Tax=Mytilinidion resinicola TaxID=574789 RepID=A0A6A6YJY4_9PEZI|nr:uncharacterized protein BDZ99DRAFT_499221 [Mytilinidion resinicola]KAF2808843.1 hypothetical protein BDZ99DRAFT_499221 [Mytilinidion resinicola]